MTQERRQDYPNMEAKISEIHRRIDDHLESEREDAAQLAGMKKDKMKGTRMAIEGCTSGNEQECPHADKSAQLAVKKVFAILGVDVDVPKDVEEFRENLRFGASMRRAADKGMFAIVAFVAVALVAALWTGIVAKVGGH